MNFTSARELLDSAVARAWELDAPAFAWALGQLSGVAEVVFDGDIGTACIRRRGSRITIAFSRSFVEKEIRSVDELLFLLLHEIFHKVHGDLYRNLGDPESPLDRMIANIVTDIRINATLIWRMFPNEVPLLSRCYQDQPFPANLLLPPLSRLKDTLGKIRMEPIRKPWGKAPVNSDLERVSRRSVFEECTRHGLQRDASLAITDLYADAWFERASMQSLFSRLRLLVQSISTIIFLGDHDWEYGGESALPGGWERLDDADSAGQGDVVEEEVIEVRVIPPPVKLINEVRRALTSDATSQRQDWDFGSESSVCFYPGRREMFLRRLGYPVLFYKQPILQKTVQDDSIRMYIDVSGSVFGILPVLYALALHLTDLMGSTAYLFSDAVVEVGIDKLKKGNVSSSGGTNFDAVIDHANAHGYQKIIMVTDCEGRINATNAARIKEDSPAVFIINTTSGEGHPLMQLARKIWNLTEFTIT